ncbi:MAG: phosphotransferase [Myxococcales bacterium]|nr:phosphotransferase [Myxococcales bacterium]
MSSLLQLSSEERHNALDGLVKRNLSTAIVQIESIAPGLGNRRFFRLRLAETTTAGQPASVIARAEAKEDPFKRAEGVPSEPPLAPLLEYLETAGIPVPKHYGGSAELAVELLEDVGSTSLEAEVGTASRALRLELYGEACSLIPRLQRLEPPQPSLPAFERRLDRPLFNSKAGRVAIWALPYWLGRDPSQAELEVVYATFSHIADVCEPAPMRFSHRDFKAANIHLRPEAPKGERLVLIDFQGAFMAPPEYDLVCLLRDSHVQLPIEDVMTQLEATRPALPDAPDPDVFNQRFTLLTLSRVAKDAAHYIRAFTAEGDSRYLGFLPAARESLREASSRAASWDPVLQRFADLVDELREPTNGHSENPS